MNFHCPWRVNAVTGILKPPLYWTYKGVSCISYPGQKTLSTWFLLSNSTIGVDAVKFRINVVRILLCIQLHWPRTIVITHFNFTLVERVFNYPFIVMSAEFEHSAASGKNFASFLHQFPIAEEQVHGTKETNGIVYKLCTGWKPHISLSKIVELTYTTY